MAFSSMMGDKAGLPEIVLSRVEMDLKVTLEEIRQTEAALMADGSNALLIKKYEALLKDRHLLLEGRNDSIRASLQNQSWLAGFQSAPGVKALLTRLALACSTWSETDLEQAADQEDIKHGTSRARPVKKELNGQSEKTAQLMLLANAADASGRDDCQGDALARILGGGYGTESSGQGVTGKRKAAPQRRPRASFPRSRYRAHGNLKAFHVARVTATYETEEDDALAHVVPVAFSAEYELAERAQQALAGLELPLEIHQMGPAASEGRTGGISPMISAEPAHHTTTMGEETADLSQELRSGTAGLSGNPSANPSANPSEFYRPQDYEGEGQSALFQPPQEASNSGTVQQGGFYAPADAQPMLSHPGAYMAHYPTMYGEARLDPGMPLPALDQSGYGVGESDQKGNMSHEMQMALQSQRQFGDLRHLGLPNLRQDMDYQQQQMLAQQQHQQQQQQQQHTQHQLHRPQVLRPVQVFYPRSLS